LWIRTNCCMQYDDAYVGRIYGLIAHIPPQVGIATPEADRIFAAPASRRRVVVAGHARVGPEESTLHVKAVAVLLVLAAVGRAALAHDVAERIVRQRIDHRSAGIDHITDTAHAIGQQPTGRAGTADPCWQLQYPLGPQIPLLHRVAVARISPHLPHVIVREAGNRRHSAEPRLPLHPLA